MTYPTNQDDVIDSRDVIEAIEDLAQLRQPGPVTLNGDLSGYDANEVDQDQLFHLLRSLESLAVQGEHVEDWEYGVTLVRDSYFKDYARELAEDIGAIPSEYTWPTSCIDWERAARELRMDYSSVDFDGVTYWVS